MPDGLGSNPGFRATDTIDNRQDPDQQGSSIAVAVHCANQHKQTAEGCGCETASGVGG